MYTVSVKGEMSCLIMINPPKRGCSGVAIVSNIRFAVYSNRNDEFCAEKHRGENIGKEVLIRTIISL